MARLVVALDNQHQNEAVIGEDWLTVWPDDFTFVRYLSDDAEVPPFPYPPGLLEGTSLEAPDPAPVAPEPEPESGNDVSQDVSQPVDTPAPSRSDLSETGSLYLPRTFGN